MSDAIAYPIGTPGHPWGEAELSLWRARRSRQRRYDHDVLPRIEGLGDGFENVAYGQLDYAGERYTLNALKWRDWDPARPAVLVTGGVHGYETSGVMGALAFLETGARDYASQLNLLVAPCVSPWGYERINRWNYDAIDPNRSFSANGPSGEASALIGLIAPLLGQFVAHIDLHETTDSDESEFRPALAARDGKPYEPGSVPDGFYRYAEPTIAVSAGDHRRCRACDPHRPARSRGRNHRLPFAGAWGDRIPGARIRHVRCYNRRTLHNHHRGLSG
jgi:hypothetical protein